MSDGFLGCGLEQTIRFSDWCKFLTPGFIEALWMVAKCTVFSIRLIRSTWDIATKRAVPNHLQSNKVRIGLKWWCFANAFNILFSFRKSPWIQTFLILQIIPAAVLFWRWKYRESCEIHLILIHTDSFLIHYNSLFASAILNSHFGIFDLIVRIFLLNG